MALNNNIKGALLMSLAMASFNFNDAMIKLVTGDLTTGQIMFIRGVMTSALILLVAWRMKALRPISVVFDRWMVLRTAGEIVGAVTYVYALSMIPLPNAAAILQALPIWVGHRPGPRAAMCLRPGRSQTAKLQWPSMRRRSQCRGA